MAKIRKVNEEPSPKLIKKAKFHITMGFCILLFISYNQIILEV